MKRILALPLSCALLAGVLLSGCAAQSAPTSTPAPTVEPTPEPTPEPAGNPLTGVDDGDYTNRRPVAVTLRNRPGSTPQWGVAAADVLVEGVTEGNYPTLMALYASPDEMTKVGPVGAARDLQLQVALPLNAVPVHIDRNIYASNLLNALSYQDLDGYHIGKTAFAFDTDRQNAGYGEENCWYTTGELVQSGLSAYNTTLDGENSPLFLFGERPAVEPESRNGTELTVTFSRDAAARLSYDADTGLYNKFNADGSPVTDADNGAQAAFTNVVVLYASSGIKDDGYTRQYDMTGGDGVYLTDGAWQAIRWAKEDATAPLQLTDADGSPLVVACGKSYIAIYGGYYGQSLTLTAADGSEQTLPENPALLESGVSDEAASAAQAEYDTQQQLVVAQAELSRAKENLQGAQDALQEAISALDADPENTELLAKRDECQAAVDALQATIEQYQPIVDAAAAAEEAPADSAESETEEPPAESAE